MPVARLVKPTQEDLRPRGKVGGEASPFDDFAAEQLHTLSQKRGNGHSALVELDPSEREATVKAAFNRVAAKLGYKLHFNTPRSAEKRSYITAGRKNREAHEAFDYNCFYVRIDQSETTAA